MLRFSRSVTNYRPQFVKVMFLHLSVSHSVLLYGGAWSRGICSRRCPGPHPRGNLRGIWSRPTPKGEVEGDLVQAHTKGGFWDGSGPVPDQKGKLRGIWSRPTPKGEVEGNLVQAHTQGGSWGGSGQGCGDPRWRLLLHAFLLSIIMSP